MNQDSTIGAQSTSVSVAIPPGERVRTRLVNRKTEILLPAWIIGKTTNIGLIPVWLTGTLGLFAGQRGFRHAHRDQRFGSRHHFVQQRCDRRADERGHDE